MLAVSFKPNIENKTEQYKEMLKRTEEKGTEALIIKCADFLDNSNYYIIGNNQENDQLLMNKLGYFLQIAEPQLKKYPIFQDLKKRHKTLRDEMAKQYNH